MSASFAFYVHHHGSGHVMRALAIARYLPKGSVSFLGSNLKPYADSIPADITCFHLPKDTVRPEDKAARIQQLDFLHYAPLNVKGLADRSSMILDVLRSLSPVLVIVDVSVEVTLLATLAGFPTVVVRQNGERDDTAHLHAYQCAQLLLAPCPAFLMDNPSHHWVTEKTFFSGGFSRYTHTKKVGNLVERQVAILIGSGGTSVDLPVISEIASQCPEHTFHVIGKIETATNIRAGNLFFHGRLTDPSHLLSQCEVVIGNAGHNTVMEMADLEKKFICITEPRPFNEQLSKGKLLELHNMCVVIDNSEIANADWRGLFEKAQQLPANRWQGMVNPDALQLIANELQNTWNKNFN